MTTLDDSAVFVHVVRAGSFTAAARLIGVQTSSVSRRVARLEADLGAKLLRRTTRQLSLTEVGELYFERATRALAELDEARALIAEQMVEPRGRVRLIAPVEHDLTTEVVGAFLAEHPEVRVEVELSDREVNILHEGIDLAIRVGPPTNLALVAHRLLLSPLQLVAAPSYLAAHGTPTSPEALAEHDCLVFGGSTTSARWPLVVDGRPRTVPVRARATINHMQALLHLVCGGAGIAALPVLVSREAVARGALQVVLPGVHPPAVPIYVTYPAGRFLAPAVRAFVQFLRQAFARVEACLSDASPR